MTSFDWVALQIDLLSSLRAGRSTAQASKALNFSYDKVKRWEQGTTRLLWPDFVAMARECDLPIHRYVAMYFGFTGDLTDTKALTASLLGTMGPTEAGRRIGLSKQKLSRWLNGHNVPTLIEVLQIMSLSMCFLDFLERIVPSGNRTLDTALSIRDRHRELHRKYPFVGMILRAFELEEYRNSICHDDETVAQWIGVSLGLLQGALEALCAIGAITRSGQHYQVTEGVRRLDTRELGKEMVAYWLGRGQEFLRGTSEDRNDGDGFFFYYNVAVNQEGLFEIRKAMQEFNDRLRKIGTEDTASPSHIRNVTVQILNPVCRNPAN